MVQKWLDCEKAMVMEMTEMGLIPAEIGDEIASKSSVNDLSPEMIGEVFAQTKHLGVSLVKAFAEMCGPAGEYYHLGATTQDILLTGLTLQMREAYDVILGQLDALELTLIIQAERYKQTVMMGRTHAQHAVPLTFGFTLASWAYEIRDHIDRLKEISPRLFRAKLTAAVGTRNSWIYLFGFKKTQQFVKQASQRMGLAHSPIDIQTRTDRLAEIGYVLANIMTSLAKIGLNIRYLNAEEIREVEEPWDLASQYSSSTMPNKRNPEASEWLDGLAKIAQGNASALSSITILGERDATRMAPSFKCIADNFLLTAAGLEKANYILSNLRVNEERMRHNLNLTHGLAMAEAVMLSLWKKTGKKVTAHKLVRDLSMQALKQQSSLQQVLLESELVQQYLTPTEINEMTNPEHYYGDAIEQVDATIAYIKQCRAKSAIASAGATIP